MCVYTCQQVWDIRHISYDGPRAKCLGYTVCWRVTQKDLSFASSCRGRDGQERGQRWEPWPKFQQCQPGAQGCQRSGGSILILTYQPDKNIRSWQCLALAAGWWALVHSWWNCSLMQYYGRSAGHGYQNCTRMFIFTIKPWTTSKVSGNTALARQLMCGPSIPQSTLEYAN